MGQSEADDHRDGPGPPWYRWGNEVVLDAMPLKEALAIARSVNGSRALEIRLLHALDAQETVYSVDLGSLQTAPRWQGSEIAKLIIRGQLDGSAAPARALTTVVGRSLTETICDLDGKNFCAEPREQERPTVGDMREGLLNSVTEDLDRSGGSREQSAPRDVRFRLNCFLLWESAFVEFAEMGFRECWFAAVASYASSNIALRNSVIDGSSWAFLAVGKKARPETAHSFEVTGNVWRQSPF